MDPSRRDAAHPWFIQHRAGGNRATWQRAVASTADYLEVDVWLQEGRVASHHAPSSTDGCRS